VLKNSPPGARNSGLVTVISGTTQNYQVLHGKHTHVLPISVEAAGTWDDMAIELVQEIGSRDVHGNVISNGTGNPMGMGIKHRIGNGNGRNGKTTSV